MPAQPCLVWEMGQGGRGGGQERAARAVPHHPQLPSDLEPTITPLPHGWSKLLFRYLKKTTLGGGIYTRRSSLTTFVQNPPVHKYQDAPISWCFVLSSPSCFSFLTPACIEPHCKSVITRGNSVINTERILYLQKQGLAEYLAWPSPPIPIPSSILQALFFFPEDEKTLLTLRAVPVLSESWINWISHHCSRCPRAHSAPRYRQPTSCQQEFQHFVNYVKIRGFGLILPRVTLVVSAVLVQLACKLERNLQELWGRCTVPAAGMWKVWDFACYPHSCPRKEKRDSIERLWLYLSLCRSVPPLQVSVSSQGCFWPRSSHPVRSAGRACEMLEYI